MKDIDEIRRENLRLLEKEMGSASIVANAAGMSLAQFINLRDGAKDSSSGRPRGMRKQTAWRIEDATNRPRGWLDQINSSSAGPEDHLLTIYRRLSKYDQQTILLQAQVLLDRKLLSPDQAADSASEG